MARRRKQKEKKTGNPNGDQVTLLIIVLAILFILLIVAKAFSVVQALNSPWKMAVQNGVVYKWDNTESRNIIFASLSSDNQTRINVLNINPTKKEITVLKLSDDIYTQLPNNLGSWPVGSSYQLGQDGKQNIGPKLLSLTVEKLLGLPVDGLVILPEDKNENISETLSSIRQNRLSYLTLLTKMQSTMSPVVLSELFWTIADIKSDNISTLDLATSNVTESKLLPDSSRVLGVNTVNLDLFVRKNLSDPVINEEGKTVAVLNGTNHGNLTADVTRLVTNLGASVIITGNTENTFSKSKVITNDISNITYKRLAQIYAPNCLDKACTEADIKVQDSRADITIILGEDYYNRYFGAL